MKRIALDDNTEVAVVFLEKHGPNICFSRNTDPRIIVDFIDKNFKLFARAE